MLGHKIPELYLGFHCIMITRDSVSKSPESLCLIVICFVDSIFHVNGRRIHGCTIIRIDVLPWKWMKKIKQSISPIRDAFGVKEVLTRKGIVSILWTKVVQMMSLSIIVINTLGFCLPSGSAVSNLHLPFL